MDGSSLQECVSRAVMAGCLAVSVPFALACLVQLVRGACRWSARTIRKVGVATFLVVGILAAWATYTGTPTLQDKSDAASRREGEAETNRLLGGGMLLQTTGDDGVTRSHGDTETRDGVSGASSPGEVSDAVPPSGPDLRVSVSPCDLESTPSIRPLTDADYAAGFALARIGTGEAWDFAPPPGAEVSDDWTRFGAARDWFRAAWYVDDGAWGAGFAFPFGTNVLGALTVFSHGTVRPDMADASSFISPLDADLGIVPESNWSLLPFNAGPADRRDDGPYRLDGGIEPSQFWHCLTPSNTFVLTWRNVLLGRDSASPVSFQAELFGNGDVVFRYDLSRLAADPVTDVVVGMSNAGGGRAFASLARSTTSLRWARLDPSRADDPDPDGDGVPTADEVFTHFTDPYRADTDMDGLSDSDEVNVHHTDPLDPHALDPDVCDGIAVNLGGYDPRACPPGSTNTVLEHVFYGGSPTAPVSRPLPTPGSSVLLVSASGTGSGELVVGGRVVPLLGSAQGAARTRALAAGGSAAGGTPLAVAVPKGENVPVLLRADGDLALELDSEEFAFGVLPDAAQGRLLGYVNFPVTEATPACIHDFNARRREVTLPVRSGAALLRCTWTGSGGVAAENVPPRSARITGNFPARSTAGASYTLAHPLHLFGRTTYAQEVRFCPVPPESGGDGDDGEEEDPPWFEAGEGDPSDGEPDSEPESCCSQGTCLRGGACDCGCDCCLGDDEGVDGGGEDAETCPVHEVDYDTCAPLHAEAYTNAVQSVEPLRDVLLIRDPPQYQEIHLVVPSGRPNCCPCPEHGTNYVGVAYRSRRLRVLGEDGNDFRISERTCDVRVAGVEPSIAPGDARLAFVRNGEVYERRNYTVLGLEIRNANGHGPSLAGYNALSASMGFPLPVGTNLWSASRLALGAKVRLPGGNVHLAFEGATGRFTLWYWDLVRGEYRRLLDTDTGGTLDLEYNRWRRMFGVRSSREPVEAPVFVTSSSPGRVRLRFRYWAVVDGRFVEDEASQVLTSVLPPLRFDVSRDGAIDDGDREGWLGGRCFRYWTNQDTVKGDFVGDEGDGSPNASDLKVNGTYDLVNFFPAALDTGDFRSSWGTTGVKYVLKPTWGQRGALNFCLADVPWARAGSIQTTNVSVLAQSGQTAPSLSQATLTELPSDGIEIPGQVLGRFSEASGLLVCEARTPGISVSFEVWKGNDLLFSYTPQMEIRPVKEMYSWFNFRALSGENAERPSVTHVLADERNTKSLVFLHGANVSEVDAEAWGDALFKRLWLSGVKADFYNVDWRSNIGGAADYHANASNAFVVASQIASTIQDIPGEKVLMAHSLGNMVVSSMIQDHHLRVSRYLMCNSAVPAEAYDPAMDHTAVLQHKDWDDYPAKARANEWYRLFDSDPDDARGRLTWSGRFADVVDVAVNFYSTGDHVLELERNNNVWAVDGYENWQQKFERFSWHKQELWKGRKGVVARIGTTDWSGWSFRENILGMNVISPTNAWLMGEADLKTNTVFRLQPESMNSCSMSLIDQGAHLAQGISARTPASGVVKWGGELLEQRMYDLNSTDVLQNGIGRPNGWISRSNGLLGTWGNRWLHSDMKDMAYFYVFKFFEIVKGKGNL